MRIVPREGNYGHRSSRILGGVYRIWVNNWRLRFPPVKSEVLGLNAGAMKQVESLVGVH